MMRLEDLKPDVRLNGVVSKGSVKVVRVDPIGEDAVRLYYKDAADKINERILFRSDESKLELLEEGRPWSFDGDGHLYRLTAEAYRIRLAHLFDPLMAIHTSNVEPYPHQITAVYEAMLPKQPLRFVLADDPGAGKTIMAGLLIKELMLRGDVKRCLIVAPGSLVEQWQDEMGDKFGLDFDIFTREMIENCRSGNPFSEKELLICRLDQLSRNDDLISKLERTDWDLIVCDEAHKMSAHYFGREIKETKRYQLGRTLGKLARHFLLMTATPHNGKEEDFQLFLALLDSDRFYGRFRDGVHSVDVKDILRRMVKEGLYKFDGTPLFPERKAYSAAYQLSPEEQDLYEAVTQYVREEFNRADQLEGKRKGTVGFALTSLQRRLASSPEAIYQSLCRRRKRLEKRIREFQSLGMRTQELSAEKDDFPWLVREDVEEYMDDLTSDERELIEDQIIDQATAARTITELESEVEILTRLEQQALQLRNSRKDRKWEELSRLVQDNELMHKPDGSRRKLIIFTEHKDTLNYLQEQLTVVLGDEKAVITIHGSVKRENRRARQEQFWNDKDVCVLVATDAAGEGVNLHCANLMINYDMPWNPNRLEQRFGRIHRIGQDEICHLWNTYALNTREGEVFHRLQEKLDVERQALGGRVFDVLGEAFEETPLKQLLMEAIRYGDDPAVRERLLRKVDGALDPAKLGEILKRNAVSESMMTKEELFERKEDLERAEARKLQPHFIKTFFDEAFSYLGGRLKQREPDRFEITYVPHEIRYTDRLIGNRMPVTEKYHRVCFDKSLIRVQGKPVAAMICPGHPLLDAVIYLVLERHRELLKRGTVLIDPLDEGTEPRVMFIIDHAIRDGSLDSSGRERVISQRMQFIEVDSIGKVKQGGYAPYLDYEPLDPAQNPFIEKLLKETWLTQDLENIAVSHAVDTLVPEHYREVRARREAAVIKTHKAVRQRLTKEITYLTSRYNYLLEEVKAGKQPRIQPENFKRRAEELTQRLKQREQELQQQRHIVAGSPVVVGGALIIPQGFIDRAEGREPVETADPEARARVERIAMEAVMAHERNLGYEPRDVSDENLGWDIESRVTEGELRLIEVKGRAKGANTVTITRNELLANHNKAGEFILALVFVDGEQADGPYYIRKKLEIEPHFSITSINFDVKRLLAMADNA